MLLHKFCGQINEDLYKIGLLLVDISHYLFKDTRDKDWRALDFNVVLSLFQHWQVILERTNGPNNKPLEHVAGVGHILDDVKRFRHSDVY